MLREQGLKVRDQARCRTRLRADDQVRKAGCQCLWEICRVNDERDSATHENLDQRRTVPIVQINVDDCSAYDTGCKQGHSLRATRGRTNHLAAGVFHGKRQV